MENIGMELKGDILTITVDLSKSQGASKSGKSQIIATTGGNHSIPKTDGVVIGLNVYKKL